MKIYIADNIHEMRKQRGMTQEQLAEALEERIHNLQKEKRFDEAAIEAEKALIRYPNDFKIVYRCGEMYQLKGMETGEAKARERAIELWNRAILLLPQNTDPEISESTIQAEIALCYLELGKQEQGIELLKKYNAGGVYNAHIGMNYAVSDYYQPEEAAHWFIKYLKSIKMNEDEVSYLDKVICLVYGKCAHFSEMLGKIYIGELEDGTAYDDLGATAMDVVEKQLQQKNLGENLRAIWQRLKEE